MECSPVGMDVSALELELNKVTGVEEIHDVHVWSLSRGKHAFTCHVKCKKEFHGEIMAQMDRILRSESFGINHSVI